jgi:hypothetical protein
MRRIGISQDEPGPLEESLLFDHPLRAKHEVKMSMEWKAANGKNPQKNGHAGTGLSRP